MSSSRNMEVSSTQYEGIETFFPLKHILVWEYWNILNYIKSLCIIFMLNWFEHFDQKIETKFSVPKRFNTLILYTTDTHFYNPSLKIASISFFSSSDTQKLHHLLGCQAIGINSPLIFFKFFAFFKFNMPSQKSCPD